MGNVQTRGGRRTGNVSGAGAAGAVTPFVLDFVLNDDRDVLNDDRDVLNDDRDELGDAVVDALLDLGDEVAEERGDATRRAAGLLAATEPGFKARFVAAGATILPIAYQSLAA